MIFRRQGIYPIVGTPIQPPLYDLTNRIIQEYREYILLIIRFVLNGNVNHLHDPHKILVQLFQKVDAIPHIRRAQPYNPKLFQTIRGKFANEINRRIPDIILDEAIHIRRSQMMNGPSAKRPK